MSEYFLGLDCSTQSLTGIIIDSTSIVYTTSIIFDKELPHYKTINGVIASDDEKVVHSYPLMWIEALELLLKKIQNNVPIKKIKVISGSGQQHGTVYLNNKFKRVLNNLNSKQPLIDQLKECFSRNTSPIWMDSSTSKQCQEIRDALGGMENTIKITGSNTFERFSGPQIRKFYQINPKGYSETSIIHLVSSFMASVLLGKNAQIDHGDGAGMNLMNIESKEWDVSALKATAPNLKEKLPLLVHSYDIIGKISPYFVKKYGFNPETLLIAWSGDNPNSLIGVGLIEKGKVAISLGTSDTYFGYLKDLNLDLKGEGHVFGAPTGDYMSLICYKNGSLARERIKDKFNLDWKNFSEILRKTKPGNNGKILLPYFFPEIVPLVLEPKVYRFGFNENDIEGNVRAIIEAQFLSMRLHSEWISEVPQEIYATGGASANIDILQIAADIFQTPIRQFDITDSAALGAALRSLKSYYNFIKKGKNWNEIVNTFLNKQFNSEIIPNFKYKGLYNDMLILYKKCEDYILRNGEDPETLRKKFIEKYFS
ncbi:MAG: carbohydrate kinase [Promethearchaeota archaeon]|nr:MAG: carbohydrate kinase [Candidatus Lokiarchaeota archaeon]